MNASNVKSGNNSVRSNQMIRVPNVRLIGSDGQQVGTLPTWEALRLAKEQGLDLVEVNAKAIPPVCKIMDFGKFKYEQKKREKEIARNQKTVETKTLNLRPTTDDHDLKVKASHIQRWISEGDKVRIVVAFKGREAAHPEIGADTVKKMLNELPPSSYILEEKLTLSGKQMTALLAPAHHHVQNTSSSQVVKSA